MKKIYQLGNYNLDGNNYPLISNNDSWEYIPEGVSKIKVCEDEEGNFCKANKYSIDSREALFLKDLVPSECD